MTKLAAETAAPAFIAPQYSRNRLFFRLRSIIDATGRAIVFARQCERHFNRYGRISPQAMAQIAERTRLAYAD